MKRTAGPPHISNKVTYQVYKVLFMFICRSTPVEWCKNPPVLHAWCHDGLVLDSTFPSARKHILHVISYVTSIWRIRYLVLGGVGG